MTILVGACYPGGVVLAGDSRTGVGPVAGPKERKVYGIKSLGLAFGLAGSVRCGKQQQHSLYEILWQRLNAQSQTYVNPDGFSQCLIDYSAIASREIPDKDAHASLLVGVAIPGKASALFTLKTQASAWMLSQGPCVSGSYTGMGYFECYWRWANWKQAGLQPQWHPQQAEQTTYPALPIDSFASKNDAREWLEQVCEWSYVAYPKDLEGPTRYAGTDEDQSFLDP
jgi:hypothetical protein